MAEMYPETKLQPEAKTPRVVTENVEREYLEYDDPKTVFRGEACDDLGGTFCETEYQKGVYQRNVKTLFIAMTTAFSMSTSSNCSVECTQV